MGKALPIAPGDRYGHLTVIERAGVYERSGAVMWRCRCDCGREITAPGYRIKSGRITKCGSWDHEILGERFGRLTVVDLDHTEGRRGYFRCLCDCGNETVVMASNLTRGHTTSCGCRKIETQADNTAAVRERNNVDGTNLGLLASGLYANNTSGIRGVYWDKRSQRWHAQIVFQGRCYSLGYYDDIADAAEARREAEEMMFAPVLEKHGRRLVSEHEFERGVYRIKHGDLRTVSEAAAYLGITKQGVIRAIEDGRLAARRDGRAYVIGERDLEAYATRRSNAMYMTPAEAAEVLGYTVQYVHIMLRDGRLAGVKDGQWRVSRAAVDEMARSMTRITLAAVASRLSLPKSEVRRLIDDGTLPATKRGRSWTVEVDDLEEFERRRDCGER